MAISRRHGFRICMPPRCIVADPQNSPTHRSPTRHRHRAWRAAGLAGPGPALEAHGLVRAVAERLVGGLAAAAECDGLPRVELVAVGVEQLRAALHDVGAVVGRCDRNVCHTFLLMHCTLYCASITL